MIKTAILFMVWIAQLYSADAFAISPENHKPVTRMAMNVYKSCTDQLGINDTLTEGIDDIVEFSGLEDESPLIDRYFNWHFYDAYRNESTAMGRSFTGARKSLHHIYDARITSLIEALKKHDKAYIYEYTGRVLHYIQDMTVPAHVAPVYHYKFYWFDQSDYFDDMTEWSSMTFTPVKNICLFENIDIEEMKERLNNVLSEVAENTRSRIQDEILQDNEHRLAGKTWEEFWILRNPDDDHNYTDTKYGFSPYGNEKRDGYKQLCEGTEKDRALCLSFFRKSYDSAVASSVKVLLLINAINQK